MPDDPAPRPGLSQADLTERAAVRYLDDELVVGVCRAAARAVLVLSRGDRAYYDPTAWIAAHLGLVGHERQVSAELPRVESALTEFGLVDRRGRRRKLIVPPMRVAILGRVLAAELRLERRMEMPVREALRGRAVALLGLADERAEVAIDAAMDMGGPIRRGSLAGAARVLLSGAFMP